MIRDYQDSDLEAVVSIWYDVAKTAYSFLPVETIEAIRNDIKYTFMPSSRTWVAIEDEKIVGFISIMENVVGGLFVSPFFQGMGVGKSLINHAKTEVGSVSIDILKESAKVLKFYERCGFVPTKEGICPITSLETVTVKLD